MLFEFGIKRNNSVSAYCPQGRKAEVLIQELYVCSRSGHFNFSPHAMGKNLNFTWNKASRNSTPASGEKIPTQLNQILFFLYSF
ncbi:hypothetical protein FK518_31010 [Klebsiella pneumoniae]|nr:hypothetical protein [Klebsiella pneumoniae]